MTALDPPVAVDRLSIIPTRLNGKKGRPSAVLVGLTVCDDGWQVIMTERAHHLAHHAGQISFPGGKVESMDRTLVDTALREAQEEIALPSDAVQVLGGLDAVVSPVGFVVQPVVGLVAADTRLVADPGEVAKVLVLPLDALVDRTRHRRDTYLRNGQPRDVWVIENDRLWAHRSALRSGRCGPCAACRCRARAWRGARPSG